MARNVLAFTFSFLIGFLLACALTPYGWAGILMLGLIWLTAGSAIDTLCVVAADAVILATRTLYLNTLGRI